MSKILITGATGFIGKALIKYMKGLDGFSELDIHVVSSKIHSDYPTIIYDTQTFSLPIIEDVDYVLHLGAYIPKSQNEASDVNSCNTSIEFTKKLLDSLVNCNVKFLFISTVDVYGLSEGIISENTMEKPLSLYGWSKLYCEKMIQNWCEQKEIRYEILRLGHIYGAGEDQYKKLIPETIKQIIQDKAPSIFSTGEEKRSFMHVDDCVSKIWQASQSEYSGKIVNVVSGHAVSVLETVELLIKVSKKDIKPIILNKVPVGRNYVFDNSKVKELYGEEEVLLEDGLREEYLYFLKK